MDGAGHRVSKREEDEEAGQCCNFRAFFPLVLLGQWPRKNDILFLVFGWIVGVPPANQLV